MPARKPRQRNQLPKRKRNITTIYPFLKRKYINYQDINYQKERPKVGDVIKWGEFIGVIIDKYHMQATHREMYYSDKFEKLDKPKIYSGAQLMLLPKIKISQRKPDR